jgi:hypothetical protein
MSAESRAVYRRYERRSRSDSVRVDRAAELRGRPSIDLSEGRSEVTVARESEIEAETGQVIVPRDEVQRARQP